MILQSQEHTAALRRLQTLLQAVDDPSEAIFVGEAFAGRLDAAILHQLIKVRAGSPSSRIDAHGWNPELVSQLDAMDGVVDVFLANRWVRRQEALMRGKA